VRLIGTTEVMPCYKADLCKGSSECIRICQPFKVIF